MVKHKPRPILFIAILALTLLSSPLTAAQDAPEEFDDITDVVASTRGLEPHQTIELTPKSREELAEDLQEDLLSDYPEEEQFGDERTLVALGLIEEGTDLGDLYLDLYSEQVAGYYDTETGEMVVVRNDTGQSGLTPSEEVTYAHETVHALQDQNFDLDAGPLDREPLNEDQQFAVSALIEGDASFSELLYLLDRPQLLEGLLTEIETMEFESEVLDAAPEIISSTLLFPYEHGYPFVEALYDERGDWELVNDAYQDPPMSTEQILHPEKYIDREAPVSVEAPDFSSTLGEDWAFIDSNTFGEFQIRIMMQQSSMSEDQAIRTAEGWGGDAYAIAGNESGDAMRWETAWDTEDDALEFARGLATYESERWNTDPDYLTTNVMQFESDEATARIVLDGSTVTYLQAPDTDTLELIAIAGPSAPGASPESTPAP